MTIFAVVLGIAFGWKWGALTGFAMIATMAVPVVVVVYMLVAAGCIKYYLGPGREHFNWFLHLVMPIAGMVLFFFPLYYQFYKYPPTYPVKYANWVAIGWLVLGIILTIWLVVARPDKLKDMDRVYVEDETVEPSAATEPA